MGLSSDLILPSPLHHTTYNNVKQKQGLEDPQLSISLCVGLENTHSAIKNYFTTLLGDDEARLSQSGDFRHACADTCCDFEDVEMGHLGLVF